MQLVSHHGLLLGVSALAAATACGVDRQRQYLNTSRDHGIAAATSSLNRSSSVLTRCSQYRSSVPLFGRADARNNMLEWNSSSSTDCSSSTDPECTGDLSSAGKRALTGRPLMRQAQAFDAVIEKLERGVCVKITAVGASTTHACGVYGSPRKGVGMYSGPSAAAAKPKNEIKCGCPDHPDPQTCPNPKSTCAVGCSYTQRFVDWLRFAYPGSCVLPVSWQLPSLKTSLTAVPLFSQPGISGPDENGTTTDILVLDFGVNDACVRTEPALPRRGKLPCHASYMGPQPLILIVILTSPACRSHPSPIAPLPASHQKAR